MIYGKPDTPRGVSPVWEAAPGNLLAKASKALGAYLILTSMYLENLFGILRRHRSKRGYRSLLRSLFEEAGLFRKNIQYSEFPEEHAV